MVVLYIEFLRTHACFCKSTADAPSVTALNKKLSVSYACRLPLPLPFGAVAGGASPDCEAAAFALAFTLAFGFAEGSALAFGIGIDFARTCMVSDSCTLRAKD